MLFKTLAGNMKAGCQKNVRKLINCWTHFILPKFEAKTTPSLNNTNLRQNRLNATRRFCAATLALPSCEIKTIMSAKCLL